MEEKDDWPLINSKLLCIFDKVAIKIALKWFYKLQVVKFQAEPIKLEEASRLFRETFLYNKESIKQKG